jgi:hypothetical protein
VSERVSTDRNVNLCGRRKKGNYKREAKGKLHSTVQVYSGP